MLELFLMGEVPEHWLRIFIHALHLNTSHLPSDVIHFNYELSPFCDGPPATKLIHFHCYS